MFSFLIGGFFNFLTINKKRIIIGFLNKNLPLAKMFFLKCKKNNISSNDETTITKKKYFRIKKTEAK